MMNQIRLFMTDLDGTLLQGDHYSVSDRTRRALRRLKENGVLLCACTGRVRCMLPPVIQEEGFDFAVTSNGAVCTDLHTGKRIFTALMNVRQARLAYETLLPCGYCFEWYVNDDILLDRATYAVWRDRIRSRWHRAYLEAGKGLVADRIEDYFDQGAPGLEKLLVVRGENPMAGDTERLDRDGSFNVTGSGGTSLEISDRDADKGNALLRLCAHLGITEKNAVAFGDGRNDANMLSLAGIGVAMAGGAENALQQADAVTGSSDEDGIADYLEKFIL